MFHLSSLFDTIRLWMPVDDAYAPTIPPRRRETIEERRKVLQRSIQARGIEIHPTDNCTHFPNNTTLLSLIMDHVRVFRYYSTRERDWEIIYAEEKNNDTRSYHCCCCRRRRHPLDISPKMKENVVTSLRIASPL